LGPDGVVAGQPEFVNDALTSDKKASFAQKKYVGDVYGNKGAGYSTWDVEFLNSNMTPE